MNINIDDDQAYIRCCQLLDEECQEEEQIFNKERRKFNMQLQNIQEHIDIFQGEKSEKIKQKSIVQQQIKQLDLEISKVNKKRKKKDQMKYQIQDQLRKIEDGNQRMQDLKQKGYEQKNLYIQLQEMQREGLEQFAKIEQEERLYQQYQKRQQRYRQLTKILKELRNKTASSDYRVQSYLKERIDDLSIVQSNLSSINQKLQEFKLVIQQQNYLIDGLKLKSSTYDFVDHDYKRYHDKYQKIYLSKDDSLQNWQNYKNHLQAILRKKNYGTVRNDVKNKQTIRQKYSRQVRNKQPKYVYYDRLKPSKTEISIFEPQDQEPSLSPSFKNIATPQNSKHREVKKQAQSIRLPKLLTKLTYDDRGTKVNNKEKQIIKSMIDNSDISLESVNASDLENLSGKFIKFEYQSD